MDEYVEFDHLENFNEMNPDDIPDMTNLEPVPMILSP